jgi:hypothetical protein
MIDINDLKIIIKEFAEKYNFLQDEDIEMVENSEPFDRKKYLKIHGKICVSIKEYQNKRELFITIGKIDIIIEHIDEEEFYSIDMDNCFTINISDFSNEDTLIETIIKECKNYNFL